MIFIGVELKIHKNTMKFYNWNGKSLKGKWQITIKVDGICGIRRPLDVVTKNGKFINNLPNINNIKDFEIAEIYCGNWNDTMSIAMATKSKRRQITNEEIYPILPVIDPRLDLGIYINPSAKLILKLFTKAVNDNYEGLVIRHYKKDILIKVKPEYTIDIPIVDIVKRSNDKTLLKEFITERGKVGTGFTLCQRKRFCTKKIIGTYIEVKCTGYTKNGKMRHPRFIRLRFDK